jgi:hypothetical protein
MERKQITEEMKIQEEWYKEARDMTLDKLPDFLNKLTEQYYHDYGTICYAISAAAIAAARSVDRSSAGGISGFQAGAVMWEFICQWNFSHNKTGLRLIDYDNFLYPQYAEEFDKVLSYGVWKAIQKEARAKVEEADEAYRKFLQDQTKYESDIAAFVKKYPDYYDRKEYYDLIGIGTSEQWEAEEKKKESGFEFAPQPPYSGPYGTEVYHHWLSIVNGKVPFGYRVERD